MILTEYGLHFRCEGDHWRCVERPDLQMLPGPEPYSVGERAFGSLDEALRRLEAIRRVRASALLDHEKCS